MKPKPHQAMWTPSEAPWSPRLLPQPVRDPPGSLGVLCPGRGQHRQLNVHPEHVLIYKGWDPSEGTSSFPRVQTQSITSAPNPQPAKDTAGSLKTPSRLGGQSMWPLPPGLLLPRPCRGSGLCRPLTRPGSYLCHTKPTGSLAPRPEWGQ